MRLAFAVAAHLDAEIMPGDEVLAGGDGAFQAKCREKIREITRSDRTVLFVSHHIQSVLSLNRRCIVREAGRIFVRGPLKECVDGYRRRCNLPPLATDDKVVDLS